jgi:hypothetical protein
VLVCFVVVIYLQVFGHVRYLHCLTLLACHFILIYARETVGFIFLDTLYLIAVCPNYW